MYAAEQSTLLRQDDNGPMQSFIKLFVRVGPGMWTCVKDGEYHGPQGRIQVTVGTTVTKGTSFMGVDLAAILEQELRMQNDNKVVQIRPPADRRNVL
jgi:hypothetical protein